MSPRSARSSGSLPSKPPALISTPTSSPTPLTFAVTAPPATVPSTTVSVSRAWAFCSCSCICWACWSRAFMSKPPSPPSPSKGFCWVIGTPLDRWVWSLVLDLLDHLGAELTLEQLGGADAALVGVEVVGVGVGVGLGPRGGALGPALVGRAGLLDRVAGSRHRVGVGRSLLRRGFGRGLGGRRRRHRRGFGCGIRGGRGLHHRRRPLGLGAGVDDRVDLPVCTDHVDRSLAQH